jgi:hypothetical protein
MTLKNLLFKWIDWPIVSPKDHFYEMRSRLLQCNFELFRQMFTCFHGYAGDTHALAKLNPVDGGISEIGQR